MKKENPFSISFGIEPLHYIERYSQTNEIIHILESDNPSNRAYMISGVRGSGKTVTLSYICDHFSTIDNWIVINVSPDTDILNRIAAKLYSNPRLKKLFINAKLDLSVFGLGVSIENGEQIFDIETALERMLVELNKYGMRVLIAIDEIINNEHVRLFASSFQIMIRQKLPIFLIMTGLYENIYNLQNEKTLTFLYRAPKIQLTSLSINAIARSYKQILNIDNEKAEHMAKLTKGYPFAYQVLGYLYWKNYEDLNSSAEIDPLIPDLENYLEEYVYEKIWTELSTKEQQIIALLVETDEMKILEIRNRLSIASGSMSVYRDRLSKKGLIDTSKYGYISLKLPFFGDIVKVWID